MATSEATSGSTILGCVAVLFGLLASAAAAMTPLGPMAVGAYLVIGELRALRFRKVLGVADLLARGSPMGEALAALDAGQALIHGEGAAESLSLGTDGFYFEEGAAAATAFNARLTRIFLARRQLALDYDSAWADWRSARAHRDVARGLGLVFVTAVLLLCAFEPSGATLFFAAPSVGPVRACVSLLAVGVLGVGTGIACRAADRLLFGAAAPHAAILSHAHAWQAKLSGSFTERRTASVVAS